MCIDVNEKRQKVKCPTEIATKSDDSNKEEPMGFIWNREKGDGCRSDSKGSRKEEEEKEGLFQHLLSIQDVYTSGNQYSPENHIMLDFNLHFIFFLVLLSYSLVPP